MEEIKEKVSLNGKEMTKEEFEEEKKRLQEKKIQIVETENGVYKTRLQD